jgi:hypothetical protein
MLAVTLVLLTTGSATSRSTPNAQAPVSTNTRPDESDVAIAVSGPAPRTSSHPDEAAVAASLSR